jgi:prepilin-type N-terminal cleavage/methylation domain-containing protein
MKRKAFTLIELLVVIAIIALLLSIVMPGLRKAKQHAARLICKTNLHNYGIAGNLYLTENDETFADPWLGLYDSGTDSQTLPGETQRFCRWHNAEYALESVPEFQGPLWSYLESEKVNLCPVFKKVSQKFGDLHPFHVSTIPIDPQFGYSQNAYLGYENNDPQWGVLKMSGVRTPARTFYFAEENMWVMNTSQTDYNGQRYRENISKAVLNDNALLARWTPNNNASYDDAFATFHSPPGGDYNEGTGNAVMLDGSVESVRPQDQGTFKKAWPKTGMVLRMALLD